ncbi:MAG: hypothetical protein JWN50_129 [Parcubacteria group bacterium]|nr:hypothetical protein [Parcubacteria group bacterium]
MKKQILVLSTNIDVDLTKNYAGQINSFDVDVIGLNDLYPEGPELEGMVELRKHGSNAELLKAIDRAFRNERYDLIVVGNNRGEGLRFAECIPDTERGRAVVIWNDHRLSDSMHRPYLTLGINRYASREDFFPSLKLFLTEDIPKLISSGESAVVGSSKLETDKLSEGALQIAADKLAMNVLAAIERGEILDRTAISDSLEEYADIRFDDRSGDSLNKLRMLRDTNPMFLKQYGQARR